MTIPDFAVSSQEAGFDEFLLIWNEHFKYGLIGLYEYYGCIQNLPSIWTTKAHVDAPIITPQEAIALLTGKQLTEGDFAHVSEHQSAMEYLQTPSLKEMESQPKLLPTQESVKGEINSLQSLDDAIKLVSPFGTASISNPKVRQAIHDWNIKQTDIAEVCEQVINATPSVWINSNGADETTCPFCHAKIYEAVGDIGELPHNNNCAYLIAKDLKTRYNGNTK